MHGMRRRDGDGDGGRRGCSGWGALPCSVASLAVNVAWIVSEITFPNAAQLGPATIDRLQVGHFEIDYSSFHSLSPLISSWMFPTSPSISHLHFLGSPSRRHLCDIFVYLSSLRQLLSALMTSARFACLLLKTFESLKRPSLWCIRSLKRKCETFRILNGSLVVMLPLGMNDTWSNHIILCSPQLMPR